MSQSRTPSIMLSNGVTRAARGNKCAESSLRKPYTIQEAVRAFCKAPKIEDMHLSRTEPVHITITSCAGDAMGSRADIKRPISTFLTYQVVRNSFTHKVQRRSGETRKGLSCLNADGAARCISESYRIEAKPEAKYLVTSRTDPYQVQKVCALNVMTTEVVRLTPGRAPPPLPYAGMTQHISTSQSLPAPTVRRYGTAGPMRGA